jgi:hypothetical protein
VVLHQVLRTELLSSSSQVLLLLLLLLVLVVVAVQCLQQTACNPTSHQVQQPHLQQQQQRMPARPP